MTPAELAAIRERAERATPGPWTYEYNVERIGIGYDVRANLGGPDVTYALARLGFETRSRHDANFIAHSRTDIPDLLSHVESLEAKLEKAREIIQQAMKFGPPLEAENHKSACWFCDMGESGRSDKGEGFHDRDCWVRRARQALEEMGE